MGNVMTTCEECRLIEDAHTRDMNTVDWRCQNKREYDVMDRRYQQAKTEHRDRVVVKYTLFSRVVHALLQN